MYVKAPHVIPILRRKERNLGMGRPTPARFLVASLLEMTDITAWQSAEFKLTQYWVGWPPPQQK